VGKRNYTEATKSALFALSTKCYFPECGVPTVTFFDEVPEKKVQIAHIHAVERNGPRWRPDVDIDAFANLILLCSFHHRRVDSKANEDIYPADLLREWKGAAEVSIRSKVDGLDRLTEDRLEAMLQQSAASARSELDAAIGLVRETSESAADLLRAVLDRLSDHFIDTDAIATLEAAAAQLRSLEDNATLLASASNGLQGLEESASTLFRASQHLQHIEEHAWMLTRAAESVAESLQTGPDVSEVLDSMNDAGQRVIYQLQLATASAQLGQSTTAGKYPQRWKYFSTGVIVALILVLVGIALAPQLGR
jgi:hypothetical protein